MPGPAATRRDAAVARGLEVAPPGTDLSVSATEGGVVVPRHACRSTASAGCSTRCRRSGSRAEAVAAVEVPP